MLSTLAGVHRIGLFLGPFAGAAVIAATDVRGAYWLGTGAALTAVVVLAVVRPDPAEAGRARQRGARPCRASASSAWRATTATCSRRSAWRSSS